MSGPEPCTVPAGLLPQEAERRCDLVGVEGVKVAGVESLVGGDVSTSRQDTDGDFMCCREVNESGISVVSFHIQTNMSQDNYYLGEFRQQVIDRRGEVEEAVTVAGEATAGRAQAVGSTISTLKP